MKIVSALMLMLTGAAGLFAIANPGLGTGITFGICIGVWILVSTFKVFGNH